MDIWYPPAHKQALTFVDRLPMRTIKNPDTTIAHTNDGGADLRPWYERPANTSHVCSHFQCLNDGTMIQYVPLDQVAYAQFDANAFAVSVEFEDDGVPARPLTDQQMNAYEALTDWLSIPRIVSPVTGGGMGWHSLYHEWNKSNHGCPGIVRITQLRTLLVPAPDVPNIGDEEDVRLVYVSGDNARGPRLLKGDGTVGAVTTAQGKQAYADSGVPVVPIPAKSYDFFVNQSPKGS